MEGKNHKKFTGSARAWLGSDRARLSSLLASARHGQGSARLCPFRPGSTWLGLARLGSVRAGSARLGLSSGSALPSSGTGCRDLIFLSSFNSEPAIYIYIRERDIGIDRNVDVDIDEKYTSGTYAQFYTTRTHLEVQEREWEICMSIGEKGRRRKESSCVECGGGGVGWS